MAEIQHPIASMVRNNMSNGVHDSKRYVYLKHPNFSEFLVYEYNLAIMNADFQFCEK